MVEERPGPASHDLPVSGDGLASGTGSDARGTVSGAAAPLAARTNPSLMKERRFAPFFWVQFSGALNDNIFKVGFTSVVTYQSVLFGVADARNAAFLIAAIFMLPFLLFSATAGQLADKYDKASLMRAVKNLEIAIMVFASIGFLIHDAYCLYVGIFLMGLHSTVFGPAKYAYLPEQLRDDELVRGNGLVEMGTFISILLGTLIGGLVASDRGGGGVLVAVICLVCALIGRVIASWIPSSAPAQASLKINWNPATETWRNLQLAHEDRTVFIGLIGISWLWFVGAVFLTSFFSFARDVLDAGPQVVTLLLAVFTVGVGGGSLLCARVVSPKRVMGLVPIGGFGMTVFAVDLYFSCHGLPIHPTGLEAGSLYDLPHFVREGIHWRILLDLLLLSISGGLYSVPLYALIQMRSPPSHRARIIAANNILNALFMVASSVLAMALGAAGSSIPTLFLTVALLNVLVIGLLCIRVPDFARQTKGLITDRLHSSRKR
jgi:MFS family permease